MTLWRNRLAHWTFNPKVAGSSPVKVISKLIKYLGVLEKLHLTPVDGFGTV